MPTLTSRGAASARGFGLLGAAPLNLQTATFTSSGSWTAPIGVTNLIVLTGAGGTGTPASSGWYSSSLGYIAYSNEWSGSLGSLSAAPTYLDVYDSSTSTLSGLNSSTGDRTIAWGPVRFYYNPATTKTYTVYEDFVTKRVRGTIVQSSGPWDNRSYQPVLGIGNGWYIAGEQYFEEPATTGGDSGAFGNNYAGGNGGAATPVTTTNVAVTPGQTYTITVASGGYITFQYYA